MITAAPYSRPIYPAYFPVQVHMLYRSTVLLLLLGEVRSQPPSAAVSGFCRSEGAFFVFGVDLAVYGRRWGKVHKNPLTKVLCKCYHRIV